MVPTTSRTTAAAGQIAVLMTAFLTLGVDRSALRAADPYHILLDNGEVLVGRLERLPGRFRIHLASSSQLVLDRKRVAHAAGTLGDLYAYRLLQLDEKDAEGHLTIARWCLRHHLLSECDRHLLQAESIGADTQQTELLRERLQIARKSRPYTSPSAPQSARPVRYGWEADRHNLLHELPRDIVRDFTTQIQPSLLSGCAAADCHGYQGSSDFKLRRPALKDLATARVTAWNLQNTLRYVRRADPLDSPLLTLPLKPHGTATKPVFKMGSQEYARLRDWVKRTVASPIAAAAPSAALETDQTEPSATASSALPDAPPSRPVEDPFDPVVFNRLYGNELPIQSEPDKPPQ